MTRSTLVWSFFPSCAERTARAAVSELTRRTSVLIVPILRSSCAEHCAKSSRVPTPIDGVGDEEPAEEEELLAEERPHSELRCVELLNRRIEVVGKERRMAVASIAVPLAVACNLGGSRFRCDAHNQSSPVVV